MSRPHGRAKVDRFNPNAWATCDSCGFLYNRKDLDWQTEWYGAKVQQTNMLRCYRCLDVMQEQHRVIILPADPVPIENPRIERYGIGNNPMDTIAITFGRGSQPVFGTMTQGGGLKAAFDGNPAKPFALCAATYVSISGDNTIGRNWLAIAQTTAGLSANQIIVNAPVNGRFLGSGATGWRLDGSNDGLSFTSITSGTTLGTIGEVINTSVSPAPFYLYHRFVLTGDGSHSVAVASLSIYGNYDVGSAVET